MAKRALWSIAAVYMNCPNCGEPLADEANSGSLMFDVTSNLDDDLECPGCSAVLKIPKPVIRELGPPK